MFQYEKFPEKWRGKKPKILLLCFSVKGNDFIKMFSEADLSMSLLDEKDEHNLIVERLNYNLDKYRYDFLVIATGIPTLSFSLARRLTRLVNDGGATVVIGELLKNETFFRHMESITTVELIPEMTVFIKPENPKTETIDLSALENVFWGGNTPSLPGKDFVIITSAIFSEGKNFSVFYPEERLEQTLKTISSVREKIPSAKIILVEMSKLTQRYIETFSQLCDMVILYNGLEELDKHNGELTLLSLGFYVIPENARNIYKISGRAYFTDDFKLEKFTGNRMTFCLDGERRYNTKFYHIPSKYIEMFKELFPILMWENSQVPCVERTLYMYLPQEDVEIVDKLGVNMLVASTGKLSQS